MGDSVSKNPHLDIFQFGEWGSGKIENPFIFLSPEFFQRILALVYETLKRYLQSKVNFISFSSLHFPFQMTN